MTEQTPSRRTRRRAPEDRATHKPRVARSAAVKAKKTPCDQCAADAFLQWADDQLGPSYNWEIGFNPPAGQRLVIEFVTATVEVPAGESARLRMYTGFSNGQAGNFDLALTPQGVRAGRSIYVATQMVRVYTDGFLAFNVNRDNATTSGYALICVSGYVV
jgi:hypothetical protein